MKLIYVPGLAFLYLLVLTSCQTAVAAPPTRGSQLWTTRNEELVAASYTRYTSKLQNDVEIRFVKNSGICETTPGVQQMSGYIDIGTNMSMVCPLVPLRIEYFLKFPQVVLVLWGETQCGDRTFHSLVGQYNHVDYGLCSICDKQAEWGSWLFFYDRPLPRWLFPCVCFLLSLYLRQKMDLVTLTQMRIRQLWIRLGKLPVFMTRNSLYWQRHPNKLEQYQQ